MQQCSQDDQQDIVQGSIVHCVQMRDVMQLVDDSSAVVSAGLSVVAENDKVLYRKGLQTLAALMYAKVFVSPPAAGIKSGIKGVTKFLKQSAFNDISIEEPVG